MIQTAHQQYLHLSFVHADIRTLNLSQHLQNKTVNVVFSNAALHWILTSSSSSSSSAAAADDDDDTLVRRGRVLQAISKCMKPGARFVVEFGAIDNIQQIVTAL